MDLGEILCSREDAARTGAMTRIIAIQMNDEGTGIVRQKCEYRAGPGGKNLVMDHVMIVPVTRYDHLHQIFQA
jgi:hypothetical protein